jgi:hypothetical protein
MRRLPYKSVPCEHCRPEDINCDFCDGSHREIRRISEERRLLEAAIDNYLKWSRGFRAAVRGSGGAK